MDAVVVTHNSEPEIRELLSCRPVREAFDRVIVIDNGSADASADLARRLGATVVRRENLGFAAGVNAGVSLVQGEKFAVLNPDIRFDSSDVVGRLEEHLADPSVGLAAPALELPGGELQDSARDVPSPVDLWRRRFRGSKPDLVRSDQPRPVPWVVGACVAIRRDAFDSVGGFDERYFLYFEDVDISVRLRSAGYGVVYDPEVRVLHAHRAASRAGFHAWATRQHMRSAARFYLRHPAYLLPRRVRRPLRWAARRMGRPNSGA